jgi:integrase
VDSATGRQDNEVGRVGDRRPVTLLVVDVPRHDEKQTVGDYLTRWLSNRISDGLRPSSAAMYRLYVERDMVPSLGHLRLGDLRPGHVERMLRDMQAAGRGATTVRRVHAVLRSALASARKAHLVPYNAATDAELPNVQPAKVRPWEADELATFLDHSASHRLGAMCEVMAFTGLRRGEACALRWEDVDFERGYLTVRSQLVEVRGQVMEGKPKTRSGEDRRVDIGQRTIGGLMAHRFAQGAERLQWGSGYTDNGRVFAREDGTDLSPGQVTKTFMRLSEAAGLRQVRLHDLRHGAASLMLAGGVDVAVVSKRMGHSSVRLTVDTYSHLLDGVGRGAADAAEAMVRPRATTEAPATTGTPDAPTLRPRSPENDEATPSRRTKPLVVRGAPSGTRTPNPLIKSQLLCQLS